MRSSPLDDPVQKTLFLVLLLAGSFISCSFYLYYRFREQIHRSIDKLVGSRKEEARISGPPSRNLSIQNAFSSQSHNAPPYVHDDARAQAIIDEEFEEFRQQVLTAGRVPSLTSTERVKPGPGPGPGRQRKTSRK